VIVWDVAGDRRLGVPFRTGFVLEAESFPPPFAISPDGRTLAVARLDGRVDLIDAETLRRTGGFEAFDGRPAVAIEYAPDGGTLAVAGVGGGVGVWDAASETRIGALLRAPRGPVEPTFYTELNEGLEGLANPHNVQALAFGQGDLLAAAEVGGTVRIWDVGRRELAGPPLHLPPAVLGLAFSPDGSRLAIPFGAIPSEDDGIEVRDVGSGERLARIPTDNEVRSAAFSPDGSLLAAGRVDGSALVWLTDGWSQAGQPLALQEASALGVAFSPDGRTLATSHDDGTVVLWDVASQRPIGSPLPGPADLVADPRGVPGGDASTTARFTPDGSRLFVLQDDGRAFRWEVDPAAWRQQVCVVAGGGLTPEQWEEIVPEQDYIEACPSG
jgi:WD40 repeat protein